MFVMERVLIRGEQDRSVVRPGGAQVATGGNLPGEAVCLPRLEAAFGGRQTCQHLRVRAEDQESALVDAQFTQRLPDVAGDQVVGCCGVRGAVIVHRGNVRACGGLGVFIIPEGVVEEPLGLVVEHHDLPELVRSRGMLPGAGR